MQDFIENKKVLLEELKSKNLEEYYDICMENGKTEEVLEYTKQHLNFWGWQGLDLGHRYSKELAAEYPQDITEIYWKEVVYFTNLGKEKNYSHAVRVLREVREILAENVFHWNKSYTINGLFCIRTNESKFTISLKCIWRRVNRYINIITIILIMLQRSLI